MFRKKKSRACVATARMVTESSTSFVNIEMVPLSADNGETVRNDVLSNAALNGEQIENQCICNRKPKTLICIGCKMFMYGRVAEKCAEHANVSFLMDFMSCPNCFGPSHFLHGVDMDHNIYKDLYANNAPTKKPISH